MMSAPMTSEGEGVRAAQAAKRRYWWTTIIALGAAVGLGVMLRVGTIAPGRMAPAWAIGCAVAMVLVCTLSIRAYNRLSDEVEHQAMHKANSFGLYFYLIVQFCWVVLATGGVLPPSDPLVMYLLTGVATLGRYGVARLAR